MAQEEPILGRFVALEVLAQDDERVELRAHDLALGREVLLVRRKEPALPGEGAESERALREARALAAVSHPGIQRIHDVLAGGAGPVLVLEPVPGETLAERLDARGRLAPDEVLALGIALADALAAVHAAGAVHRDVSERNVRLRADGSPCLTGFRLAKPAQPGLGTSLRYGARGAAPTPGALPAHPAPEQLGGEAASARSDLFALGSVLHRALSGEAAHPDLAEHGWSPPRDLRRLLPGIRPELARLVASCLARSPLARPGSAAELRDALRALAEPSAPAPARGAERRRFALACVALLAVAGLGAWHSRRLGASEPEATRDRGLEVESSRWSGAALQAGFARAHALLIGIGEAYEAGGFQVLENSVRDVLALGERLSASPADRWEVRVLVEGEATFDGIRTALAELEAALEPEDRALVYFAGHGEPHAHSGSSGWLIPADGQTLERDASRTRWLHFDTFDRFLRDARAKHVLLALDCCYGGRLAASRSATASAYEERFLTRPAKVVLSAGRADERVSDGEPRGHSPFAQVFLDALRPGAGPTTSSLLYGALLRAFADADFPQTPVLGYPPGVAPGEFVFLLE